MNVKYQNMTAIVVQVGKFGSFAMTSRKWNSERQVGEITFEDSHGTEYRCEALGLMESEIRQAIYDEVVRVRARGDARLSRG